MVSGGVEQRASTDLLPLYPPPAPAPEPAGTRAGDVDEWGRSDQMRARMRRAYGLVYRHWFRAEWEGLDKIPATGGALLVANHAGAIPTDAATIMHGIEEELGRPVYGLADYLLRSVPVVGTLCARGGGVAAHPDNAYRILRDGQLALVFPEGTKGTGKPYTERYQLRRFGRGGFVEIAMRAGVPVVPIAVIGNEESMPIIASSSWLAKLLGLPYAPLTANMVAFGPLGAVLPFPVKMRFKVLEPVHFDVDADAERYPRSRILTEAEEIRDHMQVALWEMLRQRRSIWLG